MPSILKFGIQALDGLQALHEQGYKIFFLNLCTIGFVHRDVKLANFMVGRREKEGRIYVIDLGLVKKIFKANGEMFPVCNF
jgi:serine/threonine protein kinase